MCSVAISMARSEETDNSILRRSNTQATLCKLTPACSNTKDKRRGNASLKEVARRLAVDLMQLMMMFGNGMRAKEDSRL